MGKATLGDTPSPMMRTALFHYHRHDSVLVRLPTLFVDTDDFVDADVANEIPCDENKVGCDDPVCVDIPHGITGRKCLLGCDDWDNLQASTGPGPFGVSIRRNEQRGRRVSEIGQTLWLP